MRDVCVFKTCRGWMGAVLEGKRILRIILPRKRREEVLSLLDGEPTTAGERCRKTAQSFDRYLKEGVLDLPFEPDLSSGTPFQQRVWREAMRIPPGEVMSYGELAERLGGKGLSRAVGQAMGANPLPLLVPCHRVVAADGLGGFSSGLATKRMLLAMEGRRF